MKVYKLQEIRENTKILENAPLVMMDIQLPLNKEDYEFLKEMNKLGVSVKGRYLLKNKIVGFYDNSVKSVSSNNIGLY